MLHSLQGMAKHATATAHSHCTTLDALPAVGTGSIACNLQQNQACF
jgi:hypothetical protein